MAMMTILAFEQTHRKFVALKAGATPFRTVFQLSSVGYVSRSRPPPLATTWDLFLLQCPLSVSITMPAMSKFGLQDAALEMKGSTWLIFPYKKACLSKLLERRISATSSG